MFYLCAVTAQLICAFVVAYAKSRIFHDSTRIILKLVVSFQAMDSKESMMKLLEENADFGSNLQHAYKQGELQDKETFMVIQLISVLLIDFDSSSVTSNCLALPFLKM